MKEYVIKLYTEDKISKIEIARKLDITIYYVQKYLKGIKNNPTDRHTKNENIFDIIDSPVKAYWLGFIFADGSISTYLSVGIELSTIDVGHLEKFKLFMESNADIKPTKKNCSSVRINSKKIVSDLSKYGIIPNKTYISNKLPMIREDLFRFFLTGLMDGDGWISEHKIKKTMLSQFEFGFSSYHIEILQEIKTWFETQLCKKCGYISARPGKCPQLIIGGRENFVKIYHLLYDDCPEWLDRKKEKADKYLSEITSYTKKPSGPKKGVKYRSRQ